MKKNILIIEDEEEIARGIKFNLVDEGFDVDIVLDGLEGYNIALSEIHDLIILEKSKVEVYKLWEELKQEYNTEEIMEQWGIGVLTKK